MGYYDHYPERPRNAWGVRAKRWQAAKLFGLGQRWQAESVGVKQVLEVGPGDGYLAEIATEAGHRYRAVEASTSIVSSLCARGFDVERGFVPPLPEQPPEIDACYALHVLEHFADMGTVEDFLGAVRNRLAPGGTLTVAVPDFSRWRAHFYDCDYTHVLPFTARRLRQVLRASGFEVVHDSLYAGVVFGLASAPLGWSLATLYTPTVDDVFRRVLPGDVAARGFQMFLPNVVMVARPAPL